MSFSSEDLLKIEVRIPHLKRMQDRVIELSQEIGAGGDALTQAVSTTGLKALELAEDFTPVWTGSLRASHSLEMSVADDLTAAIISISPRAVNVLTYDPVISYAEDVHMRDPQSAYYTRVIEEHGDALGEFLTKQVNKKVKW